MRTRWLVTALLNWCVAVSFTAAQEAPAPAQATTQADGGADQEVVVRGFRGDKAMYAFLTGDFVTAEAEFKNNYRCIRRLERLTESAFENAIADATQSSVRAAAGLATPNWSGNSPAFFNNPQRADEIAERTCHSPQWQLYMIGLAQIQLGRLPEAKKSLKRVIHESKEILLFDAHFRVGLLELMDGDVDRAQRRLKDLYSLQRSCERRGAKCEVHADIEDAADFLARAVANAQRVSRR